MAEKRAYVAREMRFVNEFLAKEFPTAMTWKRVRLGPARFTEEEKLYQVLRRWADAVVYDGTTVYIIEAKIRPDVRAISQLELYGKLFPKTPEFEMIKDRPVKLVFLTSIMDKEVKALCEEKGIEYKVFSPRWIKEYWKEMLRR